MKAGRNVWFVLTFAAVVCAMLQVVVAITTIFGQNWVAGIDFMPLRHAAQNLLSGHSIYADRFFVYPPTAAPLLMPLALGTTLGAFHWWVVFGIAVTAATGVFLGSRLPVHRVAGAAIATYALVGCSGAAKAFELGNMSMVLAPLAVGVLAAFHKERWLLGCALLAVSLLLKPLLVPLLLVPLVLRRWRDVVAVAVPAGVPLAGAFAFVSGGRNLKHFIGYVVGGTNLHGENAVNNLSISGWVETHSLPHVAAQAGSLIVLCATAWVSWHVRKSIDPLIPVQLGMLAFTAVLLAGGISELHFLLVLLGLVGLRLVLSPSWRAALWFLPVVIMCCIPAEQMGLYLSDGGNSYFLWLELLAFIVCIRDVLATAARTAGVTNEPAAAPDQLRQPATELNGPPAAISRVTIFGEHAPEGADAPVG